MSSGQESKDGNKSRGRRSMARMAFPNDPEAFHIHNHYASTSKPAESSTGSKESSPSSEEFITIQSTPLRLSSNTAARSKLPKGVRQDMQPPSSSGFNTPTERMSPGINPASGISQEVGTSSQLDMGAPRPGHVRTPSVGTTTPTSGASGLRRNPSTLVTNVDKHGGPRRRRSKTNLRAKSRSLSRPGSPTGSVCSDASSVSGKSLTIVLKLGTSSICDAVTHVPLIANLSRMVETIVRLKEMGHRVVLVSSGAVAIGLRRLKMPVKPKELAAKQAIAAVGQGRLMALYDDLFGLLDQPVAQVLLTRNDLSQRTQYLNACNTFEALLEMDVVPIVNENDTVSLGEIRFGDNDTLSAITAGMVHADYLFLMTDVDCLYTDNPRTNPGAKPVTNVTDLKALRDAVDVSSAGSAVGTGGMATKLIAAELATAAGVTTIITNGSSPQRVVDIIEYFTAQPDSAHEMPLPASVLCTRFVAKSRPMIDRKWWILHGMYCAGTIYVDAGAVVALARFKKSLFAAGIKRVEGVFSSNQAVRVVYEPERETVASIANINAEEARVLSAVSPGRSEVIEIGHGLVNYTSAEVSRIRGCHSSEFEAILGYCDSDNVINRGNMVVTIPEQVLDDIFITKSTSTKIRAEQRAPVLVHSPTLGAI
ncbi:Glutamate 5-kinase [Coemansia sp. Benny D115]|nr:Glutamate 5-kinase [Coemansia sp. Benny D115]